MTNRSYIIPATVIALAMIVGCFDEPTPAYKTVQPGQRIYLTDKALGMVKVSDLGTIDKGLIDYLNLDRNNLTNIEVVTQCTGIKWLRLNDNKLAALPNLKSLTNLRRIYLRNNKLTAVPETLKDLPSLTDIDLSGNPIKKVPDWLAQKEGLENLAFNATLITELPSDLSAWESLKSLQLGELKISAAEMSRIRKALPNTAIAF